MVGANTGEYHLSDGHRPITNSLSYNCYTSVIKAGSFERLVLLLLHIKKGIFHTNMSLLGHEIKLNTY